MEIGAGSGQEACGRATQNDSKIEKVEEKIDGCSAQEAEIEPPAKTRLEPKKPSKGLGGREALGSRERLWKAVTFPAKPRPKPGSRPWQAWHPASQQALALAGFGSGRLWQALRGSVAGSGRLWQVGSGRLWQALAGSGRLWQALASSGRLWQALAGSGRLWQLAGSGRLWQALAGSGRL